MSDTNNVPSTQLRYPPGEQPVFPDVKPDDTGREHQFNAVDLFGEKPAPLKDFIDYHGHVDPCIKDFIDGKTDKDKLSDCLLKRHPIEPVEALGQVIKITEKRREEVKTYTDWDSRFAFGIGPVFRKARLNYPGIFKNWNTAHPDHAARSRDGSITEDGTIGTDGQMGLHIALSTNPGFVSEGSSSLVNYTIADLSFFGDEDGYPGISGTILGIDHLNLVSDRSFFEWGLSLAQFDSESGYTVGIMSPKIGLFAQLEGAPLLQNPRVLDVTGIRSFAEDYLLVGANIHLLMLLTPIGRSAFCDRVAYNDDRRSCGGDILPGFSTDDFSFEFKANYLNAIMEERLTSHTDVVAKASISHYLLTKRLGADLDVDYEYALSPAVRFFLGAKATGFLTPGDYKPTVEHPASDYEVQGLGGFRLVPWKF